MFCVAFVYILQLKYIALDELLFWGPIGGYTYIDDKKTGSSDEKAADMQNMNEEKWICISFQVITSTY